MPSDNTITGRAGTIVVEGTLVARTKKWTVNPTLATKSEWGDSDSCGYTNRQIGRRDATFDAEGVYEIDNAAYDLFDLGVDYITAALWIGDSTTLMWWFPSALCLSFSMMVDADTEEVVGWSANFGADGIYYAPGQITAQSRPAQNCVDH